MWEQLGCHDRAAPHGAARDLGERGGAGRRAHEGDADGAHPQRRGGAGGGAAARAERTLRVLYLGRLHPSRGRQPGGGLWIAGLAAGSAASRLPPRAAGAIRPTRRRCGARWPTSAGDHVTFPRRGRAEREGGPVRERGSLHHALHRELGPRSPRRWRTAYLVIAGKGTPWSGLDSNDAGRWTPNDPESLADAIASTQRATSRGDGRPRASLDGARVRLEPGRCPTCARCTSACSRRAVEAARDAPRGPHPGIAPARPSENLSPERSPENAITT